MIIIRFERIEVHDDIFMRGKAHAPDAEAWKRPVVAMPCLDNGIEFEVQFLTMATHVARGVFMPKNAR